MIRNAIATCVLLLVGHGCSQRGESNGPPPQPEPALLSPTLNCLVEGGSLLAGEVVDNSVLVDHGPIKAMAVGEDGRVGVATEDGALKFWSAAGAEEVGSRPSFYDGAGGEGRPPSESLAIVDTTRILSGALGLTYWNLQDSLDPIAEIGSDDPVTAIALSLGAETLGAAFSRSGGFVFFDDPEQPTVELDSFAEARDAVFTPQSQLFVVGGTNYSTVRIHAHSSENTQANAIFDSAHSEILQGHGAAEGLALWGADQVVAVGSTAGPNEELQAFAALFRFVGESGELRFTEPSELLLSENHTFVGVAAVGTLALVLDDAGNLFTWQGPASELLEHPVAAPTAVAVDYDPHSDQFVTAGADGLIRYFGCSE